MNPLISIIVPIYNVEHYLPTCIRSILQQTYSNLEIILIDDGSPDKCGAICEQYKKQDRRVKVIHKKNGGLSSARNAGLDICKGEYISFIDSDDFVSPLFIEMFYNAAVELNADIVTYSSMVKFYDDESKVVFTASLDDCICANIDKNEALRQILYQKIPNGAPFRLYKRFIFESLRFPIGFLFEDVATVYKTFINADSMAIIDAKAYAYRIRQDSIVRMKFSNKKMISVHIGKQLFEDIVKYNPSLKAGAAARAFSLNFQIFLQTSRENSNERKKLWKEIKQYRKYVLLDKSPYLRIKNRCAALISFLGMEIAFSIGRKLVQK